MLSLLSKTLITSCEVPDFGGLPPSTAVSVMVIKGCFSRPSPALCIAKEKCSFGLSL
uniref:Uncharacterized protein n=1 Tax=Acanthochromis polyacanthus TaxID=80966 RepID=A0A3Q1FF73_9TELE